VILGNLDFILESQTAPEILQPELQGIKRACNIATVLARQLLDFSRQHVPTLQLVDVNETIGSLGKMLQHLVGRDITVVTQLDADDAVVLARSGALDQILVNLASNARDAIRKYGTLKISTRNVPPVRPTDRGGFDGRDIVIEVTDDGIGMSLASSKRRPDRSRSGQPKVTAPRSRSYGRWRVCVSRTGPTPCRSGNRCVEPQRGRMIRDWLGFSKKSEVKAMFPAGRGVAAPLTILIVDSSAMLRTMLKRVSQLSGIPIATILEASDRAGAFDVLAKCPVDALFVNVDASDGEGMELLRAVQARPEWSRIVRVATGMQSTIGVHGELAALRVRGTLETPFTPDRIRELLWDLISGGPSRVQ
jgi:CheY-like chemotaxis protein